MLHLVCLLQRVACRFAILIMVVSLAGLPLSCTNAPASHLPSVWFECRLSFGPTFSEPVEILIQNNSSNSGTITIFDFSGNGGYSPKRNGTPKVKLINPECWARLMEAMKSHDPWSIPSKQPYNTGFDGMTLILELRNRDRIHRVQRWEPLNHPSEKRLIKFTAAVLNSLPDP